MAADEVSEDKEAIITAMERTFSRMATDMGLSSGIAVPPLDFTSGPDGHNFTAPTFATGYDSGTGETTMAFTLDFSILYGDGTSGDLLTG